MNKDRRFFIKIKDISEVSGRTLLFGDSNMPYYKGRLGNLEVLPVHASPMKPNEAMLQVIRGNINDYNIGDILYGEA